MRIKQEQFVAFTKTDFSQAGRIDTISQHRTIETAKRQYKRIETIYGKMHGHHVWTETIDGKIICDNRPKPAETKPKELLSDLLEQCKHYQEKILPLRPDMSDNPDGSYNLYDETYNEFLEAIHHRLSDHFENLGLL